MPSQSELAHRKLRDAILAASIASGDHVGEVEWAARLQGGRFAIREALKQLQGEGLVSRESGKYRVPVPSAKTTRENRHVRAVLEAGTIRLLRRKMAAKSIRQIRQSALDFRELAQKGYFGGACEANLRFHRAIVAGSQNPQLIRLYDTANLQFLSVGSASPVMTAGEFGMAAAEHQAILAALEGGDNKRAASLLEDHLKRDELEF